MLAKQFYMVFEGVGAGYRAGIGEASIVRIPQRLATSYLGAIRRIDVVFVHSERLEKA